MYHITIMYNTMILNYQYKTYHNVIVIINTMLHINYLMYL